MKFVILSPCAIHRDEESQLHVLQTLSVEILRCAQDDRLIKVVADESEFVFVVVGLQRRNF